MPFAIFFPFTGVGAEATWMIDPSAFRVLSPYYSVYQTAGHIEMLILVDANAHPVPLDTDASIEGSSLSRLLLEARTSNLHFSLGS